MSTRSKTVSAVVVSIIVVVLLLAWWLGLFSSEPDAVSIEDAAESVSQGQSEDDDDASAAAGTSSIDGTWTIAADDATFVGYRIEEVLANIGDITAVGRTAEVSGSMQVSGTTISAVVITADVTQLKSDNGARDGQLRTQALETNDFPEATFELTVPIELGTLPGEDDTVSAVATGMLTVHGVSNEVTVDLDATRVGSSIVVVGQTALSLSDYDIVAPTAPIVASVADEGVMEFSLVFAR